MDLMQDKKKAPAENELFSLSCDFIKLNKNITNEKIPLFLLELWAVPNYTKNNEASSLSFRVFRYILELDFNSRENVSFYKSYQLFHIFQVILATTIYHAKNSLELCTIQIFRLNKYHIYNIEQPDQLYAEYVKSVNPSVLKNSLLRHKKIRFFSPSEISITSKLSNLILIEQFIREECRSTYLRDPELFERINSCVLATVEHSILFVNKNENKVIKVLVNTHSPFRKATILCGEEKKYENNNKFNPQKPINKNDKRGYYLFKMKSLSDNILFLGNGAKVVLSFRF